MNEDIIQKVRELSAVRARIEQLNERKRELEAYFLERGGDDVADTKYKSATYFDPGSQAAVTYTEAQSLTVGAPNYLKTALGGLFPDVFDEVVKTDIKPKSKSNAYSARSNPNGNGVIKMPMSDLVLLSHLNEDQKAVVDVIGMDNYRALMDVFGGDRIWIPKARSLIPTPELADYIRRRKQNGDSNEQIARDLEITVSDVRKLASK